MNKQELINEIAELTAQPKTVVATVIDALGDVARHQLDAPGTELTLPGIGKLKAVAKPARTGCNPHTGDEIKIPAKTGVKFVAAKALKDAVV